LYCALLPLLSRIVNSHVPPGSGLAASGVTVNVVAPDIGEIVAAPLPGAAFRHVEAGPIEKFPEYPFSDTAKDCAAAFGLVNMRHAGVNEKPGAGVPQAKGVGLGVGTEVDVGIGLGVAVGAVVGAALCDGVTGGAPGEGPPEPPPHATIIVARIRTPSQSRRRFIRPHKKRIGAKASVGDGSSRHLSVRHSISIFIFR
jgi:hypothetical protein